jgi:protein-S-isoprenylcysteine O-methyltransferase Ste14
MKFLLLGISILNFACYLWSVIGIFKSTPERDSTMYNLLKVITVALWISLSAAIVRTDLGESTYIVLVVVQLLLFGMFWNNVRIVRSNGFSVVFSKDIPEKIVTKGIYRYVRHPYYTTYILCYASLSIGCSDFISTLLCVGIVLVYYRAARFEEAKFGSSNLALAYESYKSQTGMFFPKVRIIRWRKPRAS